MSSLDHLRRRFLGAARAVLDCSLRSQRFALGSRLVRRRSRTERRVRSLGVHCSLRSLRLALDSRCLPHSLPDGKACLLVRSSRTAARQPGSPRRRAKRVGLLAANPPQSITLRRLCSDRRSGCFSTGRPSASAWWWHSECLRALARSFDCRSPLRHQWSSGRCRVSERGQGSSD